MASITQTIPSYIQGMSGQPDELKMPGQVTDLVNAIPDVARGLIKRPGARLINPLTDDTSGRWFNINRDRSEQYVGQVLPDGTVNIWSCNDGASLPVVYNATPPTTTPNKPDGDNQTPVQPGTPAYPNCNVDLYTSTLNEYRTLANQKFNAELEVERWRSAINNIDSKNWREIYYDAYEVKYSIPDYVVNQGYSTTHGHINQPNNAEVGQRKLRSEYHVSGAQYAAAESMYWEDKDEYYNDNLGRSGDVYEYIVDTFPQEDYDQYHVNLNAAQETLNSVIPSLASIREVWEQEAIKCGLTTDPFGYSLTRTEVSDPSVLFDYLKHVDPEELQFLTINDYTFVVNRTVKPSTTTSAVNLRSHEGFIELRNLAYSREYSVSFNTINDTDGESETIVSAAAISCNKVNWEDDDADCKLTAIENFTVNKGDDKTGLSFQIENRGQAVLVDQNDQYKGYKCEYTTNVRLLAGGVGWAKGDTVTVTMEGANYTITVTDVSTRRVLGNIGTATYSTPVDGETIVQSDDILTGLKDKIDAETFGITTTIVGNGLHVTSPQPFQVTTNTTDLLNVFTDAVNDVSRLPDQCADGYVVKVANSAELEDDYYLKFNADNGIDGYGVWEETFKPGIDSVFNGYSMPHQIVRKFNDAGNIFFEVSPVDWEDRLVGDSLTNPAPSFVGKNINKMVLYRNRLGLMADENIVLSRPGDYFNFWSKTAQVVSPIDPIDVSVSSSTPATLYDAQEVNAGLLMFSKEQQFLLTTDNDVLSPDTAKVNNISYYGFNVKTQPVSMGTTVGFLNNSGLNSRLFEITNIRREGEAEVLDQSKVIDNKLPPEIDLLAHSRANNVILLGKRGSNLVYGYQYFNTGEKRAQSAWFKWELTGNLVYQYITNDVLYLVMENSGTVSLQAIDLKYTENSAIQSLETVVPITVHMDNWRIVLPNNITYDKNVGVLGESSFDIPSGFFTTDNLRVWAIEGDDYQGQLVVPTIDGNKAKLLGDWSNTRVIVGYEFTMKITLPTIYPTRAEGDKTRSDIRSSLTIHRLKLSFGPVGVYDVTLDRYGKGSKTLQFDQREMDGYRANTIAVDLYDLETIPIYERNTSLAINISSTHPSPATLYSMTWEGDYTNRFYKRV